jgi:hypothetical protein
MFNVIKIKFAFYSISYHQIIRIIVDHLMLLSFSANNIRKKRENNNNVNLLFS